MCLILLVAKITANSLEIFTCFLICQVLLLSTYYTFKSNKISAWPWIMMLVVSLTYFIDTDYYTYREDFKRGLKGVGSKEVIYIYIAEFVKWNYTFWRVVIWGTALMLYYQTSKRLKLHPNTAIYSLVFLFAPLFAYGRVILAMTTYFYGFSFFAKPIEGRRLYSYACGCIIIPFAFLFHRTFLPIVFLTPLMLIPMTKKRFILLCCCIPFISLAINILMRSFLSSEIQMDDSFSSFQSSAERMAGSMGKTGRNWKSMMLYQTRLFSIYIPFLYVVWKYFFSKTVYFVDTYILRYFSAITVIIAFAVTILYGVRIGATEVPGMRYLYMAGIPECLLLSYLYQNEHITLKTFNTLLILGFICFEGSLIITTALHGSPF